MGVVTISARTLVPQMSSSRISVVDRVTRSLLTASLPVAPVHRFIILSSVTDKAIIGVNISEVTCMTGFAIDVYPVIYTVKPMIIIVKHVYHVTRWRGCVGCNCVRPCPPAAYREA